MDLDRNDVKMNLRRQIRCLLEEFEAKTGVTVVFKRLSASCKVPAQYEFCQPDESVVYLKNKWEDVEVAHELMHGKLELLENFSVLAWRQGVKRTANVEEAFKIIRTWVDDVVVENRLFQIGLNIDGEIIRPYYFDVRCRQVAEYLRRGFTRPFDGMADLDKYSYGQLRRSAWLVKAELILDLYKDELSNEHCELVRSFIDAFRNFRSREATRGDKILQYFRQHNVQTVEGHREILRKWVELEGLDRFVGLSSYVRNDSGYILPCPADN